MDKENRFTKELLELIKQSSGITIEMVPGMMVDRRCLIEIMGKAGTSPISAAFELPADAKYLAKCSNNKITNLQARAVLKGLYGYRRDNDPDYTAFDPEDIPKLKAITIGNKHRWLAYESALRSWK